MRHDNTFRVQRAPTLFISSSAGLLMRLTRPTISRVDEIVEGVPVGIECDLVGWITGLGRRAFLQALNCDGAKVTAVAGVVCQHQSPASHEAVNERHRRSACRYAAVRGGDNCLPATRAPAT